MTLGYYAIQTWVYAEVLDHFGVTLDLMAYASEPHPVFSRRTPTATGTATRISRSGSTPLARARGREAVSRRARPAKRRSPTQGLGIALADAGLTAAVTVLQDGPWARARAMPKTMRTTTKTPPSRKDGGEEESGDSCGCANDPCGKPTYTSGTIEPIEVPGAFKLDLPGYLAWESYMLDPGGCGKEQLGDGSTHIVPLGRTISVENQSIFQQTIASLVPRRIHLSTAAASLKISTLTRGRLVRGPCQ